MNTNQNNQLITTLITRMIFQIAPREMELFQGQKEEYLKDPQSIINKRGYGGKQDDSEKILFLAPIIREILIAVMATFEKELTGSVARLQINQVVSVSPAALKRIYDFAYKEACRYQLSPLKATLVAQAVIESLTTT